MTLATIDPINQTQKHAVCSEKYEFVSTKEIIEIAISLGWKVVKTGADRSVKYAGYQKHIVIMEKDGMEVEGEGRIQFVIRTGHARNACVNLFLGFMRICCANQINARNLGEGYSVNIRHTAGALEKVKAFLGSFDGVASDFVSRIAAMKSTTMTVEAQKEMARVLLASRFNEALITEELINQTLKPRREGDSEDNLWVVANRIQETLVRGKVEIINPVSKKTRKVRELTSNDVLLKLNDKVMDYANQLIFV